MRKAARLLAHVPEVIGGLTLLAITLVLFAGVVWRYFFVDPLTWSDEIARALFVWLAFIGAAVGVKRRLHSTVSLFSARLPARWQKVTTLFGLFIIGVMAVVLLYTGTAETVMNFRQVMPITGLSRGWLYLAVPVSGFLILVYLVPQIRNTLRGARFAHPHEIGGE